MTLTSLVEALQRIGIDAAVDEDIEGQVIVYTGLMVDPNDDKGERLVTFKEE